MTKVVFFSDLHAHIFEDFSKPDPEFVTDRFRDKIRTLQRVFEIARENNAIVLFGGDLFHKRGTLEDVVFNNVFKVIADNNDIPTYLLRGNHDSKNNTTESEHWLETFKYLPHVTVMDRPEVFTNTNYGVRIFAIPYSDDTEYLKKKIVEFAEQAKEQSYWNILTAHIGVDGSEVGRYSHRLEGAFKLGDLFPDVFDYVCLGHYHKRQFLGRLDNVFYAGNTIQDTFSDEGQDKGVFLLDLEGNTPKKPEFIPIPNKKFITLTEVTEDTQQIVDNNYVRFILPYNQAQEVEIFKEETDNIRVEIEKEYKSETRIDIDMESNEEEIVRAYTKEFYPESADIAVDILKEAMGLE